MGLASKQAQLTKIEFPERRCKTRHSNRWLKVHGKSKQCQAINGIAATCGEENKTSKRLVRRKRLGGG